MCRMCSHVQNVFSCAQCVGCAIYWMFEYIGCFHPIQNVLDGIWTSSTLQATAYCIWSVISSFSFLNRWSSFLGLFHHVLLKRDQSDWDSGIRSNDTRNAIGCNTFCIGTLYLFQYRMDYIRCSNQNVLDCIVFIQYIGCSNSMFECDGWMYWMFFLQIFLMQICNTYLH